MPLQANLSMAIKFHLRKKLQDIVSTFMETDFTMDDLYTSMFEPMEQMYHQAEMMMYELEGAVENGTMNYTDLGMDHPAMEDLNATRDAMESMYDAMMFLNDTAHALNDSMNAAMDV